jgi:hypothetical protein
MNHTQNSPTISSPFADSLNLVIYQTITCITMAKLLSTGFLHPFSATVSTEGSSDGAAPKMQ